MNHQHDTKQICCMIVALLKLGFVVTVYRLATNTQRVNSEFTARSCTPELWVPGSLEKFQGSYESRQIHFIFDAAISGRHWLLQPNIARYKKSKGINPVERAGNAVDPLCPIHGNTLFENPPTTRRKCGLPLSCMKHKWFLAWRSTYCNSSGRTSRCKTWQSASSQTWWK
jgi:hypothetical protein